jgi:hypothetical protein
VRIGPENSFALQHNRNPTSAIMAANKLMKSILTSPDLKPRVALLGRLILKLNAVDEASRREAWTDQILLPVSDEEQLSIEVAFVVTDWNLVRRLAKELAKGQLRAEYCGIFDTGDHDGLVALVDERPVLTVYASSETAMAVQIGGFDGIAHYDLDRLSRDAASMNNQTETSSDPRDRRRNTPTATRARKARERKAKVRARMNTSASQVESPIPMPRFVIRLIGDVSTATATTTSMPVAVLYRDRAPRLDDDGLPLPGAAQIGALANRVKIALAVNALQTSHALQNLGLTKNGADDKIEHELKAGPPLGVGYLLGIGRTNLAEWTGFDNEDELKRVSKVKYDLLPYRNPHVPTHDQKSRIRAELAYIKPLSKAYGRAVTILETFAKAPTMSADLARVEIRRAYKHKETEVSPSDLILRFIGRVQRGANAVLFRAVFASVRQAIKTAENERSLSQKVLVGALEDYWDLQMFSDGLKFVESAARAALIIPRGTINFAFGDEVPCP